MPEEPSGGPRRSFTGQRRDRRKKRIGSAVLRRCFAVIAVKFIEHQLTARQPLPPPLPPRLLAVEKRPDLVSRGSPAPAAETPRVFAVRAAETAAETGQSRL